ncbi:MAG: hypothetical protein M3N13_09825, partial [Candidatus Eremiobacteraeota bacterium]|nr:hypothetical protein [Candidatus Eremiobacteraeota bacterium]
MGCPLELLDRETVSCAGCGSTVRWRSVLYLVSVALFGKGLMAADIPVDKGITGIGLSDYVNYADLLAEKFSYTNTYLHQEPRFDILN